MTTRSAKRRPTAVCDGSGGFVNAFGCELLGVTTMRELELRVEDHQITVNMIDTKLSITYQLSPEGHLEENTFWTLDGGDAEFRQRAWQAAHSKARQLAWIPRLKSVA